MNLMYVWHKLFEFEFNWIIFFDEFQRFIAMIK